MSGITLMTGPGKEIKATLEVKAVDMNIPSNQEYHQKHTLSYNPEKTYQIPFTMFVRNCVIGEGLKESGACFRCSPGTFLLTIPVEPTVCDLCPNEKAFCNGGSDIGPRAGYWRSSNTSSTFFKCPVKEACLGMMPESSIYTDTYSRAVGFCNDTLGYYGVLCSGC